MFPLNGLMFIPSLVVTPLVLAVAYFWRRKSETYSRFWWPAVVICFLLTLYSTVAVFMRPLYSQGNGPEVPGGFEIGASLLEVFAFLFLILCLIVPSFPTLLGLAFLPPRNLRTSVVSILIVVYLAAASALIVEKHVTYMADYRETKRKESSWRNRQARIIMGQPPLPAQQP